MLTGVVIPLVVYMYIHNLYSEQHHFEVVNLLNSVNSSALKRDLATCGYILFYYSQSLGETKQFEQALKYATYSCNIQELYDLLLNSNALREFFLQDFSLKVN